jgi:hypothetical protein
MHGERPSYRPGTRNPKQNSGKLFGRPIACSAAIDRILDLYAPRGGPAAGSGPAR